MSVRDENLQSYFLVFYCQLIIHILISCAVFIRKSHVGNNKIFKINTFTNKMKFYSHRSEIHAQLQEWRGENEFKYMSVISVLCFLTLQDVLLLSRANYSSERAII